MFRDLRRTERQMTEADTLELLRTAEYGVLSMAGDNDYAYGVPLSYALVDGALYFHCALEGFKLDSIQKNNKVSFCVVGETETLPDKFSTRYKSVIVFGRIEEINGDEKRQALIGLLEKYSGGFMEKGLKYLANDEDKTKVLKLAIDHITGKARR